MMQTQLLISYSLDPTLQNLIITLYIQSFNKYPFNHVPLTVSISIIEKSILEKQCTIIKNSEEEEKFTFELIKAFKKVDTLLIVDKNSFELIVQEFTRFLDCI